MRRTAVRSSSLRSIGYDARRRELEIEFIDGDIYRYSGVPAARHAALLAAVSRGAYLNRQIKPRYRYRRLGLR